MKKKSKSFESPSFNVLITSISKKVPMIEAVQNACKRMSPQVKVFGADLDSNCIGKYFVDTFWNMPELHELSIKKLIHFCQKNNIKAIIPSRDGELSFFASHKKELQKHNISVMVGDRKPVSVCLDKFLFSQKLHKMKFPAIPTWLFVDPIASENLVVKDRFGAGSRYLALRLKKKEALLYAQSLKNPIFQPFVNGKEYSVDIYADSFGKVKGAIARTRDLIVDGESQITTTVSHPKLETLATQVIQKLKLNYHSILQVLEDSQGHFHILEVNGRFGGASTLSIAQGLDSFYWFLLESQGSSLKEYPFEKAKVQRKQVRYPKDLIIKEV